MKHSYSNCFARILNPSFSRVFVTLTLLGSALPALAQSQWNGGGSSPNNPADASNWSSIPTFGASNSQSFWTKAGASDLIYTAAQGTTTFTGPGGADGLTWIGWSAGGGSGGISGQQTVQVTGGTMNLNGNFGGDSGNTTGLWIGNGGGMIGFLVINGGNVRVANGTTLARDGATGTISVASGTFTTGALSASTGTAIGGSPGGGNATGTLTIGNAGQFTLTGAAANPFVFGTSFTAGVTNTSDDFLNFSGGSTGVITLNLTAATLGTGYFSSLITNGYVKIGGVVKTDLALFTINTTNPAAATLSLAPSAPVGGNALKWTGAKGSDWTTTAQGTPFNWKLISNNSNTEFVSSDSVLFDDTATATGTVNVNISDDYVSTGGVTFNNSTKSYVISSPTGFGITTGTLTKNGTGTATITTLNSYTGGTTISAGTLQLGDGTSGNDGSIFDSLFIINNGTLAFNTADAPPAYPGEISGTGNVTKTGLGTASLGGANTFTGGVTVTTGTLVSNLSVSALGANAPASTVGIASGAMVQLNQNGTATYLQTFSGSGRLRLNLSGGGDTRTSNFNAFTGIIEIASSGGNNKLVNPPTTTQLTGATIQIESGGQLFVANAPTTVANLTLTGAGNGEDRGAIRLNNGSITATNGISLMGNATIGNEGGTLIGDISSGIAGTQTLTMGTFNSGGTVLLNGNLSDGSGVLALTNSNGTTILPGTNTYSGPTTISGGTLRVEGSLAAASAVTVSGGATLAGFGTVNGTVTTTGTNSVIAPGTGGIDTLAVGTTVLTGTLAAQYNSTDCDLLDVTGDLTLDAGSSFTFTALDTPAATKFVIVKYTGTLTGTFTPPVLPSGYSLVYDTTLKEISISLSGGFSAFMDTFTGLTTAQKLPGADPDNDSISNLVEYALAGFDPTVGNGSPGSIVGKNVVFTKRPLAVSNGDLTYSIETSTTLGVAPSPWTAAPAANGSSTISYTLPTGQTKDFARLKIVQTP